MKPTLLRHLPVLAALLTLALPSLARAATLNVPSSAYPTIQAGVNAAQNGDTVLVGDGTYTGPGNVDIDFDGKNITVQSVNGAAKTIIDCGGYSSTDGSGNHRGFYIHSGETQAVVSGFTVKNGYETTISSIPISGDGGGICIDNSSAAVQNCTISGNSASGGGVFNENAIGNSTITLTNCTVSGNTAGAGGGGVENAPGNGTITLTNCTISGNTAQYGGGVFNDSYNDGNGTITLTNCTISGNTAQGDGGGVFNINYYGTITLTNCIIYDDLSNSVDTEVYNYSSDNTGTTLDYCDVEGGYSGTGDIAKDPLFVNANTGDLRLQPGSPCLGAGTPDGAPATDKDGNTRPNPPSMGAYEGAAAIVNSPPPDSTAVLLVHGTWSDAQVWLKAMTPKLVAQGYTVEAVDFPTEPETLSNETYIELQAQALSRRIGELITRSGQPSVNLICHSMGCLAARYYLEHPKLWQNSGTYAGVSKVILLGAPNLGLDGSLLDPIASVTLAHHKTEPQSSDGYDTAAVDAVDDVDDWSPAVKEMFAEWEPAPNDSDSLANPYPSDFQLTPWPNSFLLGYTSPIHPESFDVAEVIATQLLATHPFGSDYKAISGILGAIPEDDNLETTHSAYYSYEAHQLGVLYPSNGEWGVVARRVSPFLIDLNSVADTSGAKVYMVAGTDPLATAWQPVGPYNILFLRGPYGSSLQNDGVVPEDSALGRDPITKKFTVYPNAVRWPVNTFHTDLPKNVKVINQVIQWLAPSDWISTSIGAPVGMLPAIRGAHAALRRPNGTVAPVPNGTPRMLRTKTDGTASLWSVDSSGKPIYGQTYGPYADWTAVKIASGPGGATDIFWTTIDGGASYWTVDSSGGIKYSPSYGPYDGWIPTDFSVGQDGTVRLLWRSNDGAASVWTISASGKTTYSATYGPYDDWTPSHIIAAANGGTRLLWQNADGSASFWIVAANGQVSYSNTFGPYDGWTASDLAVNPDGATRLLWLNTNGSASTWSVSGSDTWTYGPTYGPYDGWTPEGFAQSSDGSSCLLWDEANGDGSFWTLDAAGNVTHMSDALSPS